jgi:hypothetical protein
MKFNTQGKRVIATLAPHIFDELDRLASEEGRATGNLAAFILEQWVRERTEPRGAPAYIINLPFPPPTPPAQINL